MMEATLLQQDIEDITGKTPQPAAANAKPAINPALKLTVEREPLLRSLSHVQSVVERRNTIPILSNVKITAENGALFITATDMDIVVTERVEAAVGKAGSLTVSAHTFYDIVRKLPEGAQISLETNTEQGQLKITAGKANFKLSYLASDEFPVMEEGALTHHFALSPAEALALIDRTRFAISMEETRYYLNGIYLHAFDAGGVATLRAVATDGHRLARMEISLPAGAAGMPGVIIPRKTVLEVKKLIEEATADIQVALSATKIRLTCGDAVLTSKLIDGTFPDYEKVIPSGNDKIMEIDCATLIKAVDRVATISSEKTRAVKFELENGQLVLSASSSETGSAREELEVNYAAGKMEIGFNSRYLLEMLSQLEGDVVQFVFADTAAPALVRDTADVGALFVIMPMRV